MSKFKVGDRVRVIVSGDDAEYWHSHEVGDIVEIEKVYDYGDYEAGNQTMMPHWIEPITTNTLTVGETYTSRNGNKWECIFVRDGKAWLVHADHNETPAYQWTIDGESISLNTDYRIVFEPVRETVQFGLKQEHNGKIHYAALRYDVVDGTPDWSTAKVTPA